MQLSHPLVSLLEEAGLAARAEVRHSLFTESAETRGRTEGHAGSDVIYALDRRVEEALVRLLSERAEALGGIVLVAEGIGEDEKTVHPEGFTEEACAWRLLVDPIDGTRGVMVDKRSAWFLAGAAPNHGHATRLRDIDCAVMVELPISRAGFGDVYAAVRGGGVRMRREPLWTDGEPLDLKPMPYAGTSIRGGFAQIARFFSPGKRELAALEEDLLERLFPRAGEGEILTFEDQYICSGGELAELIMGRDRFTADVRAALYGSPAFADRRIGHVCHPYDLAASLIAEEAGVVLTSPGGAPLDAPMDTRTPVDWVGYANPSIRAEVEPVLNALLRARGWIA